MSKLVNHQINQINVFERGEKLPSQKHNFNITLYKLSTYMM